LEEHSAHNRRTGVRAPYSLFFNIFFWLGEGGWVEILGAIGEKKLAKNSSGESGSVGEPSLGFAFGWKNL
jgi:hypothetical protein